MDMMAQRVETTVRYDGPALADHEMDVEALAPALLSLASLIQLANAEINGADANRIRVVIDANTEQKCFQIKLKAILDAYEMAKGFFGSSEADSLKNLLEWLGLIGVTPLSLFGILKIIAKREAQKPPTTLTVGGDVYNIAGDAIFHGVSPEVIKLLQSPSVVDKAKGFLSPVERDGYESVAFIDANGTKAFEANKTETKAIMALPAPDGKDGSAVEDDDAVHNPIVAVVSVKTQRNEGKARWELKWAARAAWAVIEDLEWLEKFQSGQVPVTVPLWLKVDMEMTTSKTDPDAPATFRVIKVHGVVDKRPGDQGAFFNDEPS